MQVVLVRPYLWPAGPGATIAGDPSSLFPIKARPPDVRTEFGPRPRISHVAPGTPAAAHGIAVGDRVLAIARAGGADAVRFDAPLSQSVERLAVWRASYRLGVRGPVEWHVQPSSGPARTVTLDRPSVLTLAMGKSGAGGWARRHLGMIVQTVVFSGAAVLLLLMRGYDLTAGLCVLALAFSAVGGGGPLLGAEQVIPFGGDLLTAFAWLASPLAFPTIALAILYFPTRSQSARSASLAARGAAHRRHSVIGPAAMTALYLIGVDAARPGGGRGMRRTRRCTSRRLPRRSASTCWR